MDRGEEVTVLSQENKEQWLVKDSKGNEQLVPTVYITELQPMVSIQTAWCWFCSAVSKMSVLRF